LFTNLHAESRAHAGNTVKLLHVAGEETRWGGYTGCGCCCCDGGAENAGVENAGAITYGKPSGKIADCTV